MRFSSRHQLEATFAISATLPHVYGFVRASLAEHAKGKPFVLYQTPPKRDLGERDVKLRGKTLGELGLAPQAVLLVRWEDAAWNGEWDGCSCAALV